MYNERAISASSCCNVLSSGLLSRTGFVCLTVFTATCFTLPLPATAIFEALTPLSSANAAEQSVPSELQAMVAPLEEVEGMLTDGSFTNGEFSISISTTQAATFANRVEHKLRMAKVEYTRMSAARAGDMPASVSRVVVDDDRLKQFKQTLALDRAIRLDAILEPLFSGAPSITTVQPVNL